MVEIKNALVNTIVEGIRDKKGRDISVLDMRGIDGASADFYVICDGGSNTQVEAIADSIEDTVRETLGEKPLHYEGRANAEWILIDYHDVVAHVFLPRQREFYNLEGLWSDAKRDDLPDDGE